MRPKFENNDLVWAKQRYSFPWPATVIDHPSGKKRKDSYYVFFFGTENCGWVKKKEVCPYTSYEVDIGKIKNKKYMEAVKKIAEIYHVDVQLNSPTFQMTLDEQSENDEEPVQPNDEEPVQPIDEEPVQPNDEEHVQPIDEEPVEPIDEEPVEPIDEEPVPIDEEPVQPNGVQPGPVLEPDSDSSDSDIIYLETVQVKKAINHNEATNNQGININIEKDFTKFKKPQRTKEEEEERQNKIRQMLKVRLFPKKGRKNKRKSITKKKKSLVIKAAKDASISQGSYSPSSSSCIITVNIRDYKKIIKNRLCVVLKRCDMPSSTSSGKEQSDGLPAMASTAGKEQPDF